MEQRVSLRHRANSSQGPAIPRSPLMRRILAILACYFVAVPVAVGDEIEFPDNTTSNMPGGLMIIRQGNQTTWSLGGAFLPRAVKVVTNTPEGKEIARFRFPSVFQDPYPAPMP